MAWSGAYVWSSSSVRCRSPAISPTASRRRRRPRSAVLSSALAGLLGGDERLVADSLYGSLIRHIGCTGFAVEEAQLYGAGDDVALRRVMAVVDFASAPEDGVARITAGLAPEASPGDRDAAIGRLLGDGPQAVADHAAAQCDAAESLAALLPISPGARVVASEAFERWDGMGGPYGRGGDDLAARHSHRRGRLRRRAVPGSGGPGGRARDAATSCRLATRPHGRGRVRRLGGGSVRARRERSGAAVVDPARRRAAPDAAGVGRPPR